MIEEQLKAVAPGRGGVRDFAGVHALRPDQMRRLRLDQVDLAGRRLDPGGLDHPLDEFTVSAIRSYLGFRNQRWPATTSPYFLVTRKTAHTGEPASRFWMNRLFRGLPVTAEQLRDDRIIEEALAGRPDPLHLAAVFGFGPRTGLRYAAAAQDSTEPPIVISKVEHYTHKSGD